MELDTAIGIVALVIQGCELAAKLYSKYRDQQTHASRLADVELERELSDLNKCVDRLQQPSVLSTERNHDIIAQHQQVGGHSFT